MTDVPKNLFRYWKIARITGYRYSGIAITNYCLQWHRSLFFVLVLVSTFYQYNGEVESLNFNINEVDEFELKKLFFIFPLVFFFHYKENGKGTVCRKNAFQSAKPMQSAVVPSTLPTVRSTYYTYL